MGGLLARAASRQHEDATGRGVEAPVGKRATNTHAWEFPFLVKAANRKHEVATRTETDRRSARGGVLSRSFCSAQSHRIEGPFPSTSV